MSKVSFAIGAVLWLAVLAMATAWFVRREQTQQSGSQNDVAVQDQASTEVTNARAIDSPSADATNAEPVATVLKPSENSVRIGFPTRELPNFEFDECMGGTVSRDSLKGKPWVAIFVFTRCVTTCPVISRQMMQLQKRIKDKSLDVKFVTFTVDPGFDSRDVLRQYAEVYSADHDRWKFLTGDETKIHDLIREGFAQVVMPTIGDERKPGYEVAHSNRVVLVNEDSIPVATYLATRDEDVVKLRRVLEGKDPFPEPAPISGLTFSSSAQDPLNLDIRKSVPDQSPAAEVDSDSDSNTPEAADKPASDDSNDPQPQNSDADGNSGADGNETTSENEGQSQSATPSTSDERIRLSSLAAGLTFLQTSLVKISAQVTTLAMYFPESQSPESQASDGRATESPSPETGSAEHRSSEGESGESRAGESPVSTNAKIDRQLPAWVSRLPRLNASLNSISVVLLVSGFVAIKKQHRTLHRNLMIAAFLVSVAFLMSYLTYHYQLGEYTGQRARRFVGSELATMMYKSILFPHIILAMFVPFLAIRVFQHAFACRWDQHRRLARITFPIWLFVSVTGVVIYWMLYAWPWRTVELVRA